MMSTNGCLIRIHSHMLSLDLYCLILRCLTKAIPVKPRVARCRSKAYSMFCRGLEQSGAVAKARDASGTWLINIPFAPQMTMGHFVPDIFIFWVGFPTDGHPMFTGPFGAVDLWRMQHERWRTSRRTGPSRLEARIALYKRLPRFFLNVSLWLWSTKMASVCLLVLS